MKIIYGGVYGIIFSGKGIQIRSSKEAAYTKDKLLWM